MDRICNSVELETLINSTENGGVCVLPKKEYYLTETVVIKNKENVVIDGNGAEILTRYYNNKDQSFSTDAFIIEDCKNVTLKNMKINADKPTNVSATVEEIDMENQILVVKVDDAFKMNGDEYLVTFDSVDENDNFDWQTRHYNIDNSNNRVTVVGGEIYCRNSFSGTKNEYLGDNRFKVYFPPCIFKPYVNQKVCIRHTLYGPVVITVRNSDDTVIRDITMNRVPAFALAVLTRCHNFTVDGLKLMREENSHSLMSCNLDGVHIAGVTGKFVLKNSYFEGLGDDAFNIHSVAGTATEILPDNKIKCNYCKKDPDGALPVRWCENGDLIRAYDPEDLSVMAEFKVVSFENGIMEYEDKKGDLKAGYVLQNVALAPDCIVENVVSKRPICRSLCLQTDNIEIKDCLFENVPILPIIMAPAFGVWYEVGPIHNAYIHNNTFRNCAGADGRGAKTCILASSYHGIYPNDKIKDLHKNIRIEDNVFEGDYDSLMRIGATENLCVKNNVLKGNASKGVLETVNCNNVEKDV